MTSNPHFQGSNYQSNPVDDYKKNSNKKKVKNANPSKLVTLLPAQVIVLALAVTSLLLNVYNIWSHFTFAATERFLATGLITALKIMFIWPFLKFGFWVATAIAGIWLFTFIFKQRQARNPVLWGLFSLTVACNFMGLENTILQFPVLLAGIIVIAIQYVEIIFWNTRRRSVYLWLLMLIPYGFEFGLQYEMMPVHMHYDTFLGFIQAVFGGVSVHLRVKGGKQ